MFHKKPPLTQNQLYGSLTDVYASRRMPRLLNYTPFKTCSHFAYKDITINKEAFCSWYQNYGKNY